jgi:hypothetical protein
LPDYTTNEDNTTIVNCELVIDNCFDTPPLTSFSSGVELLSENLTGKEVEVSQQLFNIDSTTIQHPPIVRFNKNTHNQDGEINSEAQNFIQHTTRDEGERGCVEQSQLDDVLQISRSVHSTTTTEDTAYQTNSQNPSSQQKAFQQKYQPVEVRNSEGEWVNGYYVHKCLIVANLEGVERKYALYDEMSEKYVFLGEIRLPRV